MTFTGDVSFKDGRSPSQTTAVMLERCLGKNKEVDSFLQELSIKPEAFFHDIDGDWIGRPFIGQHVFKVVQAAGYRGTENELWLSVMGHDAPYPTKKPRVVLKEVIRKARSKRKKSRT